MATRRSSAVTNRCHARTVLPWHRFGPYHHARARAAAKRLDLVGLEISTVDKVNMWAPVKEADGFELVRAFPAQDVDELSQGAIRERIGEVLDRIDPGVVVVHGWATREALAILEWAVARGRPAITMSASTAWDAPRRLHTEWVKSRLVRLCSAALVGGTPHVAYMESLGMPRERIFTGYDAVDNAHFARGAEKVLSTDQTGASRDRRRKFFLTVGRFIGTGPDAGVKNHFRLMESYRRYRRLAGGESWDLVILGDGDLRPQLEAYRTQLSLEPFVAMPGFKQYDELPTWYGLASAFILPSLKDTWGLVVNEAMAAGLPVVVSNRCGCAQDLVREGVNGFTFDPLDVEGLARLMHRMAHGDVDREAMGRASREIIADWGPERFADGLARAVEVALSAPRPRPTLLDRMILEALLRR